MPFSDINGKRYRVNLYDEVADGVTPPSTIQLIAGESPLEINENDSDDFFTPVRTQTGSMSVCTKLTDGNTLDLDDILPANNLTTPVRVQEFTNNSWINIWQGYLNSEIYNQAYTELPEFISLPIISLLEAWKSVYITTNTIESIGELLGDLLIKTPGIGFQYVIVPEDYAILSKLINSSIFISKKEYQTGESTIYELQGNSAYDILSAICTFMGWTARENGETLYFEVYQGYGQIADIVTQDMAALEWRGDGHQRSIRQGRRIGTVTAKLADFNIKTGLEGIPYGSFNYEVYRQIGGAGTWVYFLPSSDTSAYSNMKLRFYEGQIKMGIPYDTEHTYDFQRTSEYVDVDDMIETSIPYNNQYTRALHDPTSFANIKVGACFARMQFDESTDPDDRHTNTKDGLLVSLFPGAWVGNSSYTQHIFEMLSVMNFAALEDGYINITTALKVFLANSDIGVSQTDNQLVMDIQIGDKIWDSRNNTWVNASGNTGKYTYEFDIASASKLKGNWNQSMGIDETDGYLIPTWYMDGSTKKHVMGRITLRIYPETYIQNLFSEQRHSFISNIFFEELSIDYIMKKDELKLSDRGENTYRTHINNNFKDDIDISTNLASWMNNNPSPSLLYNEDGQSVVTSLPYLKSDGQTYAYRRPEIDLLNRMSIFYRVPRTILSLEVAHPSTPLPLLRLNGINDGKIYAPVAESRDFRNNVSKLTCIEIPNN